MGKASPAGSAAANGWLVVQPSPFDSSCACATAAPSSAEKKLCVPMIGIMATSTIASASAWTSRGAPMMRADSEVGVVVPVMSASVAQLAAQLVDLVAQPGRVLEAQIGRRFVHLLFERLDQPPELRWGED